MKKRIFKQGMALMLAAALALPANVVPAEILDQQNGDQDSCHVTDCHHRLQIAFATSPLSDPHRNLGDLRALF